jgi:sugar O-acyltransferase (sialic acid O-acetyltransferase NeuD family)
MRTDLVIAGAGGFAREAAAAVHAVNEVRPTFRLLGFLDDDPSLVGTSRAGLPILGGVDSVREPGHELADVMVVVCVGNPRDYQARQRIVERLGLPAGRYATVVHPTAAVAPDSQIGPGSVLLAQVVATAAVRIGSHVAVMPQVVLTHDNVIGDFATLASGARLGGSVHIGTGAYVGAGALVREGLTVGRWSQVGMGSLVLADVPDNQVVVGSPARYLREATPGGVAQFANGVPNGHTRVRHGS